MVEEEYLGFHIGDSRNLQQTLSEKGAPSEPYVDAIITSPPYADLQEYGKSDDQIGEQEYEKFLSDLKTVFQQCYNISTDNSTLWINTDTFRRGGRLVRLPFDIADEIENLPGYEHCMEDGCSGRLRSDRGNGEYECDVCGTRIDPLNESWRLADHIIWDKKRTRPWYAEGKLRNVYEHLSMYSKADDFKYNVDAVRETDPEEFGRWWIDYPERYNPSGKVPNNLWSFPIPKQGQWGPKLAYHPSPYPLGLVSRIIRLATDPGDTILDPFAGVGTTLAVAKALDRKAIGFELEEDYKEHYNKHVLPNAVSDTTIQDKLQNNGSGNLEYQIWTLRTHKFAFEFQRELFRHDTVDVAREDLNTVFVIADQEEFRSETPPNATLRFIFQDCESMPDRNLSQVRDTLLDDTGHSGNYYQVDFQLESGSVDEPLEASATLEQPPEDGTDDTYYLYTDGTHYWYTTQMSITDWKQEVQSGGWQRYLTDKAAPLVSTLGIRVDNPLDDDQTESSKKQAVLEQFGLEDH